MITYKRPKTIGQILTNYKHLASSKTREPVKSKSGPCGHCALLVVAMGSTTNHWCLVFHK